MRIFLALFLCHNSFAKKYIIQIRPNETSQQNSLTKHLVAHQKILSLRSKINSNPRLKAVALQNVQSIIAEAPSLESLKSQISTDLSSAYIEEDSPIYLSGVQSDNHGEKLSNSPYLKVLGFQTEVSSQYLEKFIPKNANDKALLVAVVDTGVATEHPFIKPFLSLNSGETGFDSSGFNKSSNGIDDDLNGFIDDVYGISSTDRNGNVEDVQYHGTHVSGLVKTIRDHALVNGYEQAIKIQLLPIRFFSKCETNPGDGQICGSISSAITGLDYALARGAKIINMSWGSFGNSNALFNTLKYLYQNDITLVAAAGNDASSLEALPFYPAAYSQCLPGLVSVNSISTLGGDENSIYLSNFSNYSADLVSISAPGHSSFNYVTGLLSAHSNFLTGDKFIPLSGTSMASPIVAGITAVMKSLNPLLSAHDIKDVLLKSAKIPYSSLTGAKVLNQKNLVSGYAHALDSFENALSSPHLKTNNLETCSAITSYGIAGSSAQEQNSGGGGCAALISTHGSNNDDLNPFGGNSIGLLTTLFFLVQFIRRMRYKTFRC